jgi:uncharacterized protein YneF (UPF0154 family)
MGWVAYLLTFIGGIVVGAIIGFFVSRKLFIKQMKKNPPINEKMIRAMYMQMGRKPSEADIHRVMKSMDQNKK